MADTGLTQLGALRIQAQQRSDQVNSNFIGTTEWNSLLSLAYKELYDLLVVSYGDFYEFGLPYAFRTVGTQQLYPLPNGTTTVDALTGLVAAPFYKLCGVDLQVTPSPESWVTLRRFEFTERNSYQLPGQLTLYGATSLRYKVIGQNLWLTPVPNPSQVVQLWYVPKPTNLQVTFAGRTTVGSPTVLVSDTSAMAVGMSLADLALPQGATPILAAGATILSINPGISVTASVNAAATSALYLFAAWSDATTCDGTAGWEQYIIVDAAIKALVKEESDPSALMAEKEGLRTRIIEAAQNRDASLPARVSDSQSLGWPGSVLGWGGGSW